MRMHICIYCNSHASLDIPSECVYEITLITEPENNMFSSYLVHVKLNMSVFM